MAHVNRLKGALALADLNLLHVFLAIFELRSLTAAAERLGLTQPAISHSLRRLRDLLDDPLFVRTPAGMVPTEAARRLGTPLAQAFGMIGEALQQRARFDASTAGRTFKVSMSDMAELFFLPPLLGRLAEVAPGIRLDVATVPADTLCSALRAGAIDLALGFIPDLGAGCISEPLFRDGHVCMVRAGHPLRKRTPTPQELATLRYAVADSNATGHRIHARRLEEMGFRPDVAVRLPHFTIACHIAQHTDLAVVMPRSIARCLNRGRAFRIFPLPFALPEIEVQMHTHAQFSTDPGLGWLRALVLDMFGQRDAASPTGRTGR
jgi:DNA-binding transcriptional LysR family regulator